MPEADRGEASTSSAATAAITGSTRAAAALIITATSKASAAGQSIMAATPVRDVFVGVSDTQKNWNTKRLGRKVGVDVMAASAAGAAVAPLITMIDRAIIENASGRAPLTTSLRTSLITLLTRPQNFLLSRPFFLVFTLYTGTYLAANSMDTIASTVNNTPASSTTHGTSKFLATTSANISLCLYKDAQFTRMFGARSPAGEVVKRAVPMATYTLFAMRDAMTVFASFCVPPVLAKWLPEMQGRIGEYMTRASVAQFVAPAACQIFSTPLHLLGLDLYNRPRGNGDVRWGGRVEKVVRDYGKSCLARIGRIVPAFGVGGVVNMAVRGRGMRALEGS